MTHTDLNMVHDVATDAVSLPNPYAMGYGGKIPTAHRIKYGPAERWHRVYVMLYSNSGTAYIRHRGEVLIIDDHTLSTLKDPPTCVCGEPVAKLAQPIPATGWATNVPLDRREYGHADGEPLCPVMTSTGYLPCHPFNGEAGADA